MSLQDLDPLEQADFVEFERVELERRYYELAAVITATARTPESAQRILDAVKASFFFDEEATASREKNAMSALIRAQEYAFSLRPVSGGGVMEITKNDRVRGKSSDAELHRPAAERGA